MGVEYVVAAPQNPRRSLAMARCPSWLRAGPRATSGQLQ